MKNKHLLPEWEFFFGQLLHVCQAFECTLHEIRRVFPCTITAVTLLI